MLTFESFKINFENLTFNLEVIFRVAFKINHKQKIFFIFQFWKIIETSIENRINRELIAHFPNIRTKCQTETAETG